MPTVSALTQVPVLLRSEAETAALARRLANVAEPGSVLALRGPLGAGKTAFARGFIRALAGAEEEVPSPTFTLVQCYDTDRGLIWHFDLYRVTSSEELHELGLEDAFGGLAVLIEWPEKLGAALPARRLDIELEPAGTPEARQAVLTARGGDPLLARAGLEPSA